MYELGWCRLLLVGDAAVSAVLPVLAVADNGRLVVLTAAAGAAAVVDDRVCRLSATTEDEGNDPCSLALLLP